MGRSRTTVPRVASWEAGAIDLSATPAKSADYLTEGQLSDATGLAVSTILDSLTRPPITRTDKPRSAICRPAARIGRMPLWSPQQLATYLDIRERQESAADPARQLEAVTPEEAEKRNLHSIIEYAEMFGLHDQTLRRAQSQDETFPKAVARRKKEVAGVPEHLFEHDKMTAWIDNRRSVDQSATS